MRQSRDWKVWTLAFVAIYQTVVYPILATQFSFWQSGLARSWKHVGFSIVSLVVLIGSGLLSSGFRYHVLSRILALLVGLYILFRAMPLVFSP